MRYPSLFMFCVFIACSAHAQPFDAWLAELRQEALENGISATLMDTVVAQAKPIPRVIELDRKQPEFTLTFQQYMDRVVPESRVRKGKQKFAENEALLHEIGKKYGVQPRFIVALWGIETDFGRVSGGFRVINALLTLAHDGRRSAFFRKELLQALKILDAGHISLDKMMGSWAGAMGQVQFMPSSFNNFAEDGDGDGAKDIWTNRKDALSSAANYLAKSSWKADRTWGRRVKLPPHFDLTLVGNKKRSKPISAWQALGVRRLDGSDLPDRDLQAWIVMPGKAEGPAYLVYSNYQVILKWNRSDYFATAVGTLADRIAGD